MSIREIRARQRYRSRECSLRYCSMRLYRCARDRLSARIWIRAPERRTLNVSSFCARASKFRNLRRICSSGPFFVLRAHARAIRSLCTAVSSHSSTTCLRDNCLHLFLPKRNCRLHRNTSALNSRDCITLLDDTVIASILPRARGDIACLHMSDYPRVGKKRERGRAIRRWWFLQS